MNVKLTHEHEEICKAIAAVRKGEWDQPWWTDHVNTFVGRDINGGFRSQTTIWMRLRCNDLHCPATALANLDWLLTQINNELTLKEVS